MSENRRRETAEATLRLFLKENLISLQRINYVREKWARLAADEALAALSDDTYWQRPANRDTWQLRFMTTDEGNRVCPGPPQDRDGWMRTDWWFPARKRARRAPTLAWTLRQVRDYVDGAQDLYEFYWRVLPILSFYKSYPDDPNDRLCYFWREVGGFCGSVLRVGSGDDERHLRTYVGLWLIALKLSKSEWRDVVKKQGRPLDSFADNWTSLG
jgi:hypothetical protein